MPHQGLHSYLYEFLSYLLPSLWSMSLHLRVISGLLRRLVSWLVSSSLTLAAARCCCFGTLPAGVQVKSQRLRDIQHCLCLLRFGVIPDLNMETMDAEVVTRLRQLLQDVDMETTTGDQLTSVQARVVSLALRLTRQPILQRSNSENNWNRN